MDTDNRVVKARGRGGACWGLVGGGQSGEREKGTSVVVSIKFFKKWQRSPHTDRPGRCEFRERQTNQPKPGQRQRLDRRKWKQDWLEFEGKGRILNLAEGSNGKAHGYQRHNKAEVASQSVKSKERAPGTQKFYTNNDFKFLNVSYLDMCFIRSMANILHSLMNFLYFKPASNCFQGFMSVWPISEIGAGPYHIKTQCATPLSH